jgi:hypothetical protein
MGIIKSTKTAQEEYFYKLLDSDNLLEKNTAILSLTLIEYFQLKGISYIPIQGTSFFDADNVSQQVSYLDYSDFISKLESVTNTYFYFSGANFGYRNNSLQFQVACSFEKSVKNNKHYEEPVAKIDNRKPIVELEKLKQKVKEFMLV